MVIKENKLRQMISEAIKNVLLKEDSGYYPTGAEYDSSAPWRQDESNLIGTSTYWIVEELESAGIDESILSGFENIFNGKYSFTIEFDVDGNVISDGGLEHYILKQLPENVAKVIKKNFNEWAMKVYDNNDIEWNQIREE